MWSLPTLIYSNWDFFIPQLLCSWFTTSSCPVFLFPIFFIKLYIVIKQILRLVAIEINLLHKHRINPCQEFITVFYGRLLWTVLAGWLTRHWLERQSLSVLSLPENRTPLIKESLTCKDKGRLDGRLHFDAQVGIRAKKHQVYKVVSVLETVYLARALSTFYIGWN